MAPAGPSDRHVPGAGPVESIPLRHGAAGVDAIVVQVTGSARRDRPQRLPDTAPLSGSARPPAEVARLGYPHKQTGPMTGCGGGSRYGGRQPAGTCNLGGTTMPGRDQGTAVDRWCVDNPCREQFVGDREVPQHPRTIWMPLCPRQPSEPARVVCTKGLPYATQPFDSASKDLATQPLVCHSSRRCGRCHCRSRGLPGQSTHRP